MCECEHQAWHSFCVVVFGYANQHTITFVSLFLYVFMISWRYLEDALFPYGSLHLIHTNLICFSGQQPSLYLCQHPKLVLTCTAVAIIANECKCVPGKLLMLERHLWLEWCSWLWKGWTPVPSSVQRIRGTLRSSVPFLIFECTLDAMPAVESQISIFFLMPVLQKLPHPFYELSNNPCSPILACKGPSRYSRWSWGLTIKKQFLQNTGGGVRRTDVREAVWLSDMRVFVFLCWPVVVWILSDQNWTLGYIYCLNTFIVFL